MAAAMLAVTSPVRAFIGDVSGDGRVDTLDARLIAGFLVGTSTSVPRPENADVNNDGLITTADALLIMQVSKGLRTSFASNALEVLAVMPSSGTTGVQLTANFSVFFSEPVLSGSLNGITLTDMVTSLPVAGSFTPSQDGVIATFVPEQPFSPNRLYRINVTTAVKDNGGQALVQAFQSTFQTQVLGTGILVSTNNLSAPINELAPQTVVFRALNNLGVPVKQVPVTFTARMGSGVFEPSKSRQIVVLTDDTGFARSDFRLGGEAVLHTVDVSAVGFSTVPKYTALALPLPAANLRIYSGNSQNGAPGTTAPFHLIAQATDAGGNPVAGTTITFSVIQGYGNFGGQPTAAAPTDSSGTARASFTFGTTTGPISIQASFLGLAGQSPTFSLLNLALQPSSPTVITGRAIDASTLLPISHIYVYLVDNPSIWDWTDEFGAFILTTTPGSHVVSVNGFESGPIGGVQYPVIAIPVNAVQGQINDIAMPALLPQLDPLSYIDVSDTQGGTLTLRADPRWQIYVAPGQARFANGTGTGRLYVASVPPDRIPMPVAGGKTSRFFDTIQPLNVLFDPPAQVSFPNADNLPAGTVTDIFTLSYTSGTFVRTGRGQVSEDGQLVRSLPGEGITQGGWHNSPSPRPDPTTCVNGTIVDQSGYPRIGCTVTLFGNSVPTDERGRYELCNVPAQGPLAPLVSCPEDDQDSIDSDGDGFPDALEKNYHHDPEDPDDKPTVSIELFPEAIYAFPGEQKPLFAVVFIDNQVVSGQSVEFETDTNAYAFVPPNAVTASPAIVQVVGLRPGQTQMTARVPKFKGASAAATFLILSNLGGGYELDTQILIDALSDTCTTNPANTRPTRPFKANSDNFISNYKSQGLFAGEIAKSEVLEVTKADAAGLCISVPISQQDVATRLQNMGISDAGARPITESAIVASITLFLEGFNSFMKRFFTGFREIDIDDNDKRVVASATANLRTLATHDGGILRLNMAGGVIAFRANSAGNKWPNLITGK